MPSPSFVRWLATAFAVSMLTRGVAILAMLLPVAAFAHGGGLDANGCHHDRKNGGYHCHRAPAAGSEATTPPHTSGFVDTNRPTGGSGARNVSGDTERRLDELKRLRDRGFVTEEEYQNKRREILDGL
jgi:hypothetical protein